MLLGLILAALLLLSVVHWWVITTHARVQAQSLTAFATPLLEALSRESPTDEQLKNEVSELRRRSAELESNFELLKAEARGQIQKIAAAESRMRRMKQSFAEEQPEAETEELAPWEMAARAIGEGNDVGADSGAPASSNQPSGALISYMMRRRK